MSVAEYNAQIVASVSTTLTLRKPNADALDHLAKAIDSAPHGSELVADLATGVGKTYVAGGLLDYLAESGVRNVVIVTPGSTIQRKTIDNLTPGRPKYLRGLTCKPLIITMDDFERGGVAHALDDPDQFKVFIFTVQSLLSPNTKENRRAHRPHETLGQSLSDYLRELDDLVVIADEHHVYFSDKARQFKAAISALDPAVIVGLTATPHPSTPKENIVYRYPLADAIADGFVKIPVLVARADGLKDTRTQLSDGVALLDAKRAAIEAFCARTKEQPVEPVMLVVAQTIDEAGRMRDILAGPDLLGKEEAVLLVTSEEPDETLRLLDGIEDPGSEIRAVVSVSMLKEGWDCKSIYVIAAVRAMESELLTEQILGRGLRLPFGRRTGVGMLDSVEVISHHKFADLLAQAEVLLSQTLGERADEATAVVSGTPGMGGTPVALPGTAGAFKSTLGGAVVDDAASAVQTGEVVISLPGAAGTTGGHAGQSSLFDDDQAEDTHAVGGLATIEARLADAEAARVALTTVYKARSIGKVTLPLFIPQVKIRWVREPYSLTSVNSIDVEALGSRFANDNAPTLRRKALDAVRDAAGVHITIEDRSEEGRVTAYQPRLPFPYIQDDLVARLLSSNSVAATVAEAKAALVVAHAFLTGARVTEDTPWREEHGRLATEALLGWIRTKQAGAPISKVVDVSQVRWPVPAELTLTSQAATRHLVTGSKVFLRSQPYSGWTRGVFEVATFDAYSTEFRLAEGFDTDPNVAAWVRVTPDVPLAITYASGAASRVYLPDFIVIDDAGVQWIVEGKADSDMSDAVVEAKATAAREWVATVNASPDVHTRWGYLLVSESVVTVAAGRWSALKSAGQLYLS